MCDLQVTNWHKHYIWVLLNDRNRYIVRRAFAVACPLVWNSLPGYRREESVGTDTFRQHLKFCLFLTDTYSALVLLTIMRYINLHPFTAVACHKTTFAFYYKTSSIMAYFGIWHWFSMRMHEERIRPHTHFNDSFNCRNLLLPLPLPRWGPIFTNLL